MARPSPRAVVRLSEKIDTSVIRARRSSIRKVPTIAKTPDPEGEQRRHHRSENEDEQDQGDGKGDRLGSDQVGLDGFVHLGEERTLAADRHLESLKLAAVLVRELTRSTGEARTGCLPPWRKAGHGSRRRSAVGPANPASSRS